MIRLITDQSVGSKIPTSSCLHVKVCLEKTAPDSERLLPSVYDSLLVCLNGRQTLGGGGSYRPLLSIDEDLTAGNVHSVPRQSQTQLVRS